MIYPIRDMGKDGVATDVDPYSTTFTQFSFASNARFEDKKVSRGPMFSTSGVIALNAQPAYAISYKELSGLYQFHIANADGSVTNWSSSGIGQPSVETNISPTGYTPSVYSAAFSSTIINDVVYLNRPDRVPWFKLKAGTQFATLTNWDSTWRCNALREVAGVLVAINVTKGAVAYPTMIKTSDYMVFDTVPDSWVGSTTNSATENIIPDLSEPLVDGLLLRGVMILYTANETWLMQPTYDNTMFSYSRLFTSHGMIGVNCATEVSNVHYVFGSTDIWKHDGFTPKSIAAGRVRDFIYNSIQSDQSQLFFTQHNARLNEVMFCYLSTDAYCQFPIGGSIGYPGCNRAAVYNYRADTWYFYDLPYVTSMGLGVPFAGSTYTNEGTATYANLGGATYSSFASGSALGLLTVAPAVGSLACAVRSFDRYGSNAANGILDTAATAPTYMVNAGIDMDQFHENLRTYKVLTSLYPEARLSATSLPLMFSIGVSDYASNPPPNFSTPQSYDGGLNYKLDFNHGGRYLAFQVTYADFQDFSLAGFDVDYTPTGKR